MGLRSWILKPYLEKIYNLEDEVKDLKENSYDVCMIPGLLWKK